MSVIFKMFNTNVPKLFLVILTISMHGMAQTGKNNFKLPTQPSFDPRISEFDWFSSSTTHHKLDNLNSSITIKNPPFILPESVDTLVDPTKDRDKVQRFRK